MPHPLPGKNKKNRIVLPKGLVRAEDWWLACEALQCAMLIVNRDGRVQYANPAAQRDLGGDVISKKWDQVFLYYLHIPLNEHTEVETDLPVLRALAGESVDRETWKVTTARQMTYDLILFAAPLVDGQQVQGAVMTWQSPAKVSLVPSGGEESLRKLVDAVPEAMYLLDPGGTILSCNLAGAEALGRSSIDLQGVCLFDLIPPETAALQRRKLENVVSSGRPLRFEEIAGGKHFDLFLYPILDEIKRVVHVAVFVLNTTVYRKMEHELRKSEERYRNLVESTSDVVFQLDASYNFVYVSPVIEQTLHYRPDELIGRDFTGIIFPEDQMAVMGFLAKPDVDAQRLEFRMVDSRRKSHSVSVAFRHTGNHNAHPSIIGILTDITEKRQAAEELRYREERFRSLIEKTMDIILIVNLKGKIDYASPSVETVLGYSSEEMIGKRAITFVHEDDVHKLIQAVKYGLYTADFGRYIEFRVVTKEGKHRIIEAIGRNLVDNPAIAGIVINARDITERRIAEDKLWYLSTHDTMTDLYNRAYFNEEIARIERGRLFPISIFMTDLDGLKEVNDDLGHSAGDELLKRTAQLLRSSFRSEDVVARIGGDEFAVLLPGADENAAQAAMARVRRNLQSINETMGDPRLSLSFGVATGQKGVPLEEVLRKADENMYAEKLAKLGRKARGTGPLSGQGYLP